MDHDEIFGACPPSTDPIVGMGALVGREDDVQMDDRWLRMGSLGKLGEYASPCAQPPRAIWSGQAGKVKWSEPSVCN
jgi:hypothetical protein